MSTEFFEEGFSKFDSSVRSNIIDEIFEEAPKLASGQASSNATPIQRKPALSLEVNNNNTMPVPSPSSRTASGGESSRIEKSLHELDDLIQQRRVELSNMRKGHKIRLADKVCIVRCLLIYSSSFTLLLWIFINYCYCSIAIFSEQYASGCEDSIPSS